MVILELFNLLLRHSHLKRSTPSQINLIKNEKNIILMIEKIKK